MSSEIDHDVQSATAHRQSAKALIRAGERVLLVKERHSDGTPFWTLPGGGIEPDETPAGALERELTEELGCVAPIQSHLTSLWYAHTGPNHVVSEWRIYRCHQPPQFTPHLSAGIIDAKWVHPTELPPETLLPVRYLLDTDYLSTEANGPASQE